MKSMLPEDGQKYLAEFLGTFMLVFSIGCNVLAGSKNWCAVSIACTLMVLVYIFGSVSGANLNPAVSIALGVAKKQPWKKMGIYCVLQILGAICAGFTYGLIFWETFALQPAKGFTVWEAGFAELLFTCMLCFVVLHVDGGVGPYFDDRGAPNGAAGNQYYGLAIGFVLMAAIPGAGHISGGAFNPAVAIGIDLSNVSLGLFRFYYWVPYAVFEVLGAILAAVLFRFTDPTKQLDSVGPGKPNLRSKLISEFLGTFFLVLTVGLNVLGKSLAPVYSIAAALMVMIYALGRVSGAHFNPAVTLAIWLTQRGLIKPMEVVLYWAMQFFGGLAGAVVYAVLEQGVTFKLEVGKGFSWGSVAFAEVTFTFLLCYVVLAVATSKTSKSQFFGFAIGSCVTAGGIAIGPISGGVLNPAVAFAVSTVSLINGAQFWQCIIWILFELLGAMCAAAIFMATRPSEYKKEKESLAG